MVYPEEVRILMKTTLKYKTAYKKLETTAKFKNLGEKYQINLNLTNKDLRIYRFEINENSLIYHDGNTYQCTSESIKIGTPRHLVVFAKLLA